MLWYLGSRHDADLSSRSTRDAMAEAASHYRGFKVRPAEPRADVPEGEGY
jgi:hypothetical protein